MNWIKQNWVKIGLGIIILVILFVVICNTNPPSVAISDNEQKFIELEKSLPQFEDYLAKIYPIPPKPIIDHESSPYGMRYRTFIENMASTSEIWDENGRQFFPRTEYDMGGHYLISRYGTGNPDVLIVDGLTGKVFNEFGGIDYKVRVNSFLVIFEPLRMDCFTALGNYQCNNPRYVKWNGEQFITICEPIIEDWKVVSCGVR